MTNLVDALLAHARTRPDQLAVVSRDGRWTYRDLVDRVIRTSDLLGRLGVGRGDRVVVVVPAVLEFVEVYYAAHFLGATVITMNTMSTDHEVEHVLRDARPALAVVWHANAGSVTAACVRHDVALHTLTRSTAPTAVEGSPVSREAADPAVLLYSSGTTGTPKGVELSVSALEATAACFIPTLELTADDVWATALPLFHVYGQCVIMHTALSAGATLVLEAPFDPRRLVEVARSEHVTMISGVPTMWRAMSEVAATLPESERHLPRLRLVTSGGAPLPANAIADFEALFGCRILEGYGLTETTGAVSFNDLASPARAGAVGRALPGLEVEIRDAAGLVLAPGEVGQVHVSGPTLMTGYVDAPEATAQVLADGWLATGDVGHLDPEGHLTLVGRLKELIIRGGYNVYPAEVEDVLTRHPAVREALVIGIPDEKYGEEVAALVVPVPGVVPGLVELDAWARSELSAYKVPRVFHFVEDLPKNATGKVIRSRVEADVVAARGLRVHRVRAARADA